MHEFTVVIIAVSRSKRTNLLAISLGITIKIILRNRTMKNEATAPTKSAKQTATQRKKVAPVASNDAELIERYAIENAQHDAIRLFNETGVRHIVETIRDGVFAAVPVQNDAPHQQPTQEPEQPPQKKVWRQKTLVNGVIDTNAQLDPESFIHLTDKNGIKSTIANLKHLFDSYAIQCDYDVILKKQTITMHTPDDDGDLNETAMYAEISSLIALNNMKSSCIDLLPALMKKNQRNPVLDFITSKKWDKRHDYIGDLLASLTVADDDIAYKNKAVVTWLIQCVAAADSARSTPIAHAKPKYELVLILQGGQGARKTSWFQSLLPHEMSQYIKDGVHLDPDKVDSKKKATSCWICELGEIGSTFRKSDAEQLKAFLSNTHDEMRLPYDKVESNFKRRTSYCGSVNQMEFLVDSTGSRRFLPLSILGCNHLHGIDMQQLWAQVWDLYIGGQQWWCDDELEKMLESRHDKHSETNNIASLIADRFDVTTTEKGETSHHLSITRILANCGIPVPTNVQIKQAKEYLEKCGFTSNKIRGNRGYWINMI